MNGIKFYHEDIKEVKVDKDRNLIIIFKNTENSKKIKRHLVKQFAGDHLDK